MEAEKANQSKDSSSQQKVETKILYRVISLVGVLKLFKGGKRLQSNSDFMNKIKERSNTAIFKPNATIKLGALFITNSSRNNREKQRASDNINHS